MLRSLMLIVSLLTGLAAPAANAAAKDSWGKPGTSFLEYRTDAVECAYQAETKAAVSIPAVDLAYMTDAAMPGAQPSFDLTQGNLTQPNMDVTALVDHAAQAQMRMNKVWREVARQLKPALETCLRSRGYRPFRLDKDQIDQLKRLPAGSRARQVYLWNLSLIAPSERGR